MSEKIYDSVIIGGGPAGLAVANTFHKNNINYIVFERTFIGSNISRFPVSMEFFSDRRLLEIDGFPLAIPEEKPTREQYLTYIYHFARSRKLNIEDYTEVLSVTKTSGNIFKIAITRKGGKKSEVYSRTIVNACGAFDDPRYLNVKGEDLPHVTHYFTEVFPYLNHSVLIIGSGNSAVEVALKLYRSGCEVGLSFRQNELSSSKIKYWMYPDIKKRIEKKEIISYPQTEVVEIQPDKIILRDSNKSEFDVQYDFVLALTGYNPPLDFLKRLGIEVETGTNVPIHNPETLETSQPGIFIAGVITGGNISGKVFIENSRDHGEIILPRLKEILK